MNGEILEIKVGTICKVAYDNGENVIETAIKKIPVNEVFIKKLGPEGDEVADKKHHGGIDKALFSVSVETFENLNKISNLLLNWNGEGVYGENLVVSGINEDNICIGDIYELGECIIEISQPRKPCYKLSKNTNCPEMLNNIIKSGWTGWYSRIIKEGNIKKGDKIILKKRIYPNLTIKTLNNLLINHKGKEEILKEAVNAEQLASAFKKYLIPKLEN